MKWAYPTHSIYLDGPGYPLYTATIQGHNNRFKLRVRYYTEKDTSRSSSRSSGASTTSS